ncbi:MAG: AAA family ATPase [Patescibacteria group bacterium]|nr:AAA family ATPase [Patescibacteria group bacterium]
MDPNAANQTNQSSPNQNLSNGNVKSDSSSTEKPNETSTINTSIDPAQSIINGQSEMVGIEEFDQTSPQAQRPVIQNSYQSASNDQLRRLGEKVEKASLPQELKQLLVERIQRLALLRVSSGHLSSNYIVEYENTSAYINWAVNLPWETSTKDALDLVAAKKILDKNHFGLPSVKDRILEYLAAIILSEKNSIAQGNKEHILRAPILCLVGLVGTGKTTLASSIAEALGRKFERIPFGGMGDARVLRGQSRAFPDAEPGSIVKKICHSQAKNSVILLDELDRVSAEARADIMGVLVELLDPGQNHAFVDHYIDYPFDLSQVLFIATANNTTNISTAVLDRLEIIQMPSYSNDEKITIAKSYLFPKIRQNVGLLENQIVISDSVWSSVIRPLGFDSGIRSLERTIEGMCRKVARLIVEGKGQSYQITEQNMKEFLPSW